MSAVIPELSEARMKHIIQEHCRTDEGGSETLPSKSQGKSYFPTGMSHEEIKGLVVHKAMQEADRSSSSPRGITKHFYAMKEWFAANNGKKVELCIEMKNVEGKDIIWNAYPQFYGT